MDKFSLAQEINIFADPMLNNGADMESVKKKGEILCQYFKDNPEDITNNGRTSYHVGSAMYFYLNTISNEEKSQEYRFALLVASVNFYEALKFGDAQSVASAYRLHLLLTQNSDFFIPVILQLTNESLGSILNKNKDEIDKDVRKFMSYVEYCLFMFCQQDGAQMGWLVLHKEEKDEFQRLYAKYVQRYKIEDFNNRKLFEIGNKWLNAIINVLIENKLQSYMFLGII